MKQKKPIITFLGDPNEEWEPIRPLKPLAYVTNPPVLIENKQRYVDYLGRSWEREWDFDGTNHGEWVQI